MVYSPNIPLPGDFLSDSQQDIKNNFTIADDVMGINHYKFSIDNGTQGKHQWAELVNQTSYPITQAAGEGTLFTKNIDPMPLVNNDSQLFYTPDATGRQYQLTTFIESQFATFGTNTEYQAAGVGIPSLNGGWTFLPGGLLFQYGKCNTVINQAVTTTLITFPVPFKIGTTPYSITLGVLAGVASATRPIATIASASTNTGFTATVSVTTNAPTLFWNAIGIHA